MSAREDPRNDLEWQLTLSGVSAEEAHRWLGQYRDQILREAAEKIRQGVIADPEFRSNFELGLDHAADLIDPDKQ